MRRIILLIAIGLCLQLGWYSPAQSAPEVPVRVKELNFVFLHGAGGNVCSMQLLADFITEQIPAYIAEYELSNPDTEVQLIYCCGVIPMMWILRPGPITSLKALMSICPISRI